MAMKTSTMDLVAISSYFSLSPVLPWQSTQPLLENDQVVPGKAFAVRIWSPTGGGGGVT